MSKKLNFDNLLFTTEATNAITDIAARLGAFSQMTGSDEEPEIWGEPQEDGSLIIKIEAKSGSGGSARGDLEIPAEHWGYSQ